MRRQPRQAFAPLRDTSATSNGPMNFSRQEAKTQNISVFSFCLLCRAAVRYRFCLSHSHYPMISFYAKKVNGKMRIFADFCNALIISHLHSLLIP